MSGFSWSAAVCSFLLTYLVHSTVIIVGIAMLVRTATRFQQPMLRVLAWKSALILPLLTAACMTFFPFPHLGLQVVLSHSEEAQVAQQSIAVPERPTLSLEASESARMPSMEAESRYFPSNPQQETELGRTTELPVPTSLQTIWTGLSALWGVWVLVGFARLLMQVKRLRHLLDKTESLSEPGVSDLLSQLSRKMGVARAVALHSSNSISGALTAGVLRPFIVVEADGNGTLSWRGDTGHANRGKADDHDFQWEALLAHELAHVAHRDAFWNLMIQVVQRLFPCQPLNRVVGRKIQVAMDFAADERAAKVLGDQAGLVKCLIRMGDRVSNRQMHALTQTGLVAGMVAFRSTLGQRVERLLTMRGPQPDAASFTKFAVLTTLTVFSFSAALVIPQAVAETRPHIPGKQSPLSKEKSMKPHFLSLAVLIGLTSPVAADEPQQSTSDKPATASLKATPDELPDGIRQFNGMLVGRLAAKDVEKGTFVVAIDAVPRVWRNSQAENPKSIVGKTVEVEGVFGRFLDVLVTTRRGETLEFECKHAGDGLVFPGELLRKVAAYDPDDYPVLPEGFRGFRGAVVADIQKKDPETFELIVEVQEIAETSKESSARKPESIVGKQMMLAGFWNRKDAYHDLKVGDRIEAGVRHVGRQSDHLTVADFVRVVAKTESTRMEKRKTASQGMDKGVRGFRGMLVGRLVKKDVERGTFTVNVDAVPRVWKNNQSSAPKSLIGKEVDAEAVPSRLLDALVVARIGDTIEFGALSDGGEAVRVGEVLRKVEPVKPGDYPVLPDAFRNFSGIVVGKVVEKNEHLWELIIEITEIKKSFEKDRSQNAEAVIGKRVMVGGFWNRKDAYHSVSVGDVIEVGVEHPLQLSDHLSVIEGVRKREND